MRIPITALSVLFLIAACSQTQPPADPSVITARSDAWEAALNAGDIDALAGLYTDDARLMSPGTATTTGIAAVREAFGGMIDAGLRGTLTSVEASVAGDIGYNIGTFELTTGDEVVDTGKFVEIWHRGADGEWRIASDIWNSDAAPVAEEETGQHSHMMILHEVTDGDAWMAAWQGEDSRHDLFEANGAAHVHTFRNADNPNLTGLVVAVRDLDALMALFASEEGRAAAEADGVDLDAMTVLMQAE